LGIAQLNRIDEIIATRRRVQSLYQQRLANEPRVQLQKVHPEV